MTNFKMKPASQIGAPISKQEFQQLTATYQEKFSGQVPSVFIRSELIMKSIEGLSNVSGIEFMYGLNDKDDEKSRRIILVPVYNRSSGESDIVRINSRNGYLCDNGEKVEFEGLLKLLGNHVSNFKGIEPGIVRSRVPRGYMWGINKILKLLKVDESGGLVFHFGFNNNITTTCRQHQNILEVVDNDQKSLGVFMEWGQCTPPCEPCPPNDPDCNGYCVATLVSKNDMEAESKLDELRAFRDTWLINQPEGPSMYELYYYLSFGIVKEMKDQPDQEAIFQDVYDRIFVKWLNLIRQQKFEEAKDFYIDLMYNLAKRFLVQEAEIETVIQ